MTDPKRHSTALMVLGVHRSGTSSLAGVLHLLGVELGARLLAPRKDVNARGFWEQSDIVALHDRLLDSLGSRWDSMYPLPDNWWQSAEIAPVSQAIRDTLEQEFGNAELWGVKDPRLCRLLPLWLNILEQLNCQPAFVIIYRNPLEVAASLSRRDQMATSHALNLWLQHMLDAEYYSRTGPRTWVAYHDLLDDWRNTVRRIAGDLALQWPRDIDAIGGEIDRFLEPALRHHRHSEEDLLAMPGLSPWIRELYAALQAYRDTGDAGLGDRFDAVRREFELAVPLFSPLLQSEEKRLRDVESGFFQACESIDQYQESIEHYQKDTERLGSALQDVDRGFNQAMSMLKARDEELAKANALLTPGVQALAKALGEWPDEKPPTESVTPDTGDDDKVYEGVIDLRVANNSHTRLFNFIQENSGGQRSRILEVGCASGYFGQALKDAGHEVWGVEMSPKAAARARQRLDHVFVGTMEEFLALDSLRGVKFDYITFGDVLEHLVDPEQVLRDCRRILSPAGAIAASIPNIAHKAVRMMLLQGRWEYADFGILDSTHLRFFTRDSVVDTFTRAGYRIQGMDFVVLEAEQTGISFDSGLLESTAGLIKDDDQNVFQYTVLARKAEASEDLHASNARFKDGAEPHILCLLPLTDWTVGDIRIRNPLEKFRQQYGGQFRVRNVFEPLQEDLAWADTVVLQRESNKYVLSLIDTLQKLGKRIVIDMDDLLTEVPPFLLCYDHSVQVRPYLQEALRMVDAVTVTTGRLKDEMQAYNPNVFVVPNCVYSVHQPARHYPDEQAGVNLLVASSDTVRVDFIVPALRRLLADPQLTLQIIGIGPPGKFLHEAGLNVQMHENMGYEHFKAYLSSLDNTIGIVPLDDSRFSACKSPVKYLDFARAGIPAVCSDVPPYNDVVRDQETGFLCANREEDWSEAVRKLALSVALRADIARAARRFCESEYSMAHAAECWHEVFVRVDAGQGRAGSPLLTGWHHAPLLLQHITNPASYRSALRVLRTEGFRGIRTRLARFL